jgi:hypothetical protein
MRCKARLALLSLIGGFMMFASPLGAQEKQSTPDRVVPELAVPKPEEKARKPQAFERKAEGPQARDLGCCATDFWISCTGAFHLSGARGKGIYVYRGTKYDTGWSFVDGIEVGGRQGWTYREDGFSFYMFFSKFRSSNGKYELLSSTDNANFQHYGWAD